MTKFWGTPETEIGKIHPEEQFPLYFVLINEFASETMFLTELVSIFTGTEAEYFGVAAKIP